LAGMALPRFLWRWLLPNKRLAIGDGKRRVTGGAANR
jgi:hypothetical protein